MKDRLYSRQNLDFILNDVLNTPSLTRFDYFASHTEQSFGMVLDTADKIAERYLRPYFKDADRNPAVFEDGKTKVHPAIADYYKQYCESGLMSACFDEKLGGQQLPRSVYAAADFIIGNSHNGFEMFTSLTQGAIRLLATFASPELINEFVPQLVNGDSSATMCLTEPQAGSSLSDITTEASHQRDEVYLIKGQKIFISAGDHNITNNIIHLVLARTLNAPKGVKGISLFVVPKKRRSNDGNLIANDVITAGIFHKMGQKSTPAVHLVFGGDDNCLGYRIGDEGKGLHMMFQMMNTARLGVGMAATYIASAAYYSSLQYAKERLQGRRAHEKEANQPPTAIIHHPDVRRMLFSQKAFVEGMLSFLLECYQYSDLEKADDKLKSRYRDLLELLTPVAKTYGAEQGIESVNLGLQVLGGYGYTEDFALEQFSRDVRIMSLYEGTTGIQSQALLGRQVLQNPSAFVYWKEEVMGVSNSAAEHDSLKEYSAILSDQVELLEEINTHIIDKAKQVNTEVVLSDANLYMEMFGRICMAWQWLKQAVAAQKKLNVPGASERIFLQSKIETMQFFYHYELVKTKGLFARLKDRKVLTVWKEEEVLI